MLTYQNGKNAEYYPSEVTEALLKIVDGELAEEFSTDKQKEELTDVIYNLMAIAENPYNREGYKMLYQILDNITKEVENQSIVNKWRN